MLQPINVYVKLPGDIADALLRVAAEEGRNPREQAGLFIVDGLRARGALPAEPANPDRADNRTPVGAG